MGDPKTARAVECAHAGAVKLVAILAFATLMQNTDHAIFPGEEEAQMEAIVREELSNDPSGFNLVNRVVRETYDPNIPNPLGLPRQPSMIPPANELEVTQLGLQKAAEVFKKIYLRGTVAGLGPMPKRGS